MHISSWAKSVKRGLAPSILVVVFFAGIADAAPVWESILSENVGFGGDVTGGAGGQLVTVTNLNDSGAGSLREALTVPSAKWIRFDPGLSGTINLSGRLDIPSNTTIDGRGADITLDWGNSNYGLYTTENSNIIFMYLKLQNSGYDLVHLRNGFSGAWVHHVSFGLTGDEQLSIRNGADNITISWCRFDENHKGALLRVHTEVAPVDAIYSHVTLHHNFWNSVSQRTPKIANLGRYHIFNDYVFEWDYAGTRAIHNAQVRIESTIFEPRLGTTKTTELRAATPFEADRTSGLMKLVDNLFMGGAVGEENNPDSVFVPPYSYSKDPANQSTRDSIVAGAGWQDVPFPDDVAAQQQPMPPGAFGAQ